MLLNYIYILIISVFHVSCVLICMHSERPVFVLCSWHFASLRLQRLLHNVVSHAFIFVLSETSFESRPPSNHLYKAPRERHLPSGACIPPWTVNHLRLRPPSLVWEWRGRTDSLSSPVSVCGARATV